MAQKSFLLSLRVRPWTTLQRSARVLLLELSMLSLLLVGDVLRGEVALLLLLLRLLSFHLHEQLLLLLLGEDGWRV